MLTHQTLPLPVREYIRDEEIKVNYLDLENVLGFLYFKNICVNKNKHLYKKRFNICHELGHYYFGDKTSFPFKGYNFLEKRADNYAMQALLPIKELLEEGEKYEWDLTLLEKVFGVENQVIAIRIKQIFNP